MNKVYLQLEAGSGNLFEYSKEPKEGFEKHVSINKSTQTETTSYRKYHKEGVFGTLSSFSTRESERGGQKIMELSIVMDNGDTRFYINFPLKDAKGYIQSYAVAAIAYLPALVEGKAYRIFPYAIPRKDNPTKKNYGVAINFARLSDNAVDKDNKITQLTYEAQSKDGKITPGDIPRVIWNDVAGAMIGDGTNRTVYLWDILQKHSIAGSGGGVKTFNSTIEAEEPAPDQKAAPSATPKDIATGSGGAMQPNGNFDSTAGTDVQDAVIIDEEDDDLPF